MQIILILVLSFFAFSLPFALDLNLYSLHDSLEGKSLEIQFVDNSIISKKG